MAEIHVRAGAAGAGGTLPSLAAAADVVKPGDIVIAHEGVYKPFKADVDGVAWLAAAGEKPVVDGGWKQNDLGKDEDDNSGIGISAADILIRGFEVRNVPGRGIVIGPGARNVVIEHFHVHHTFHGGIVVNGMGKTVRNVTIRRGVVEYISLSTRWKETPVNGCFPVKDTDGILIEDVAIQFGGGEGIAAGTQTRNFVARRVTVANTKHVAGYVNRAQDVLWEDCIFRQDNLPEWRQGDGDVGGPLPIGDEVTPGKFKNGPHSERVTLRRCVFVGTGTLFGVRNNANNAATGGYDTTIKEFVVEGCTFVSRPWTKAGIAIQENPHGDKIAGVIRNNVFVTDQMRPGATLYRSNAPGVRFIGNAWTSIPQGAGIGAGNVQIDAAELVAPFATPFDIDNLRPVAGGVVAVNGWGALAVAGQEPPPPPPPPPPPDPDPEPGAVDWDALLEKAAGVGARLATMGEAGNKAREHLAAANAELAVMSLAHEDAVDDMAALLTMLEEYRLG
jgi:hypothetical protein